MHLSVLQLGVLKALDDAERGGSATATRTHLLADRAANVVAELSAAGLTQEGGGMVCVALSAVDAAFVPHDFVYGEPHARKDQKD